MKETFITTICMGMEDTDGMMKRYMKVLFNTIKWMVWEKSLGQMEGAI